MSWHNFSPGAARARSVEESAAMARPSVLARWSAWWVAMSWNSTSMLLSASLSWLLMMPTLLYTRNLFVRPLGLAPGWKGGCSLARGALTC